MVTARYLKLLLMRHAQSLGNLQGQMEGQSSTALSDLGHQQAIQLSESLTQLCNQSNWPTHIYSSPLLRASQTTHYLTAALQQLNQSFCSDQTVALQEIHPGVFQGLTWVQAQSTYPDICARLLSSMTWQPVPQAESLLEVRTRAQTWVKHILQKHQPGDVIWAMSHAGLLQHLVSVVMGCDRTWKIPIAHTAIFEFWLAINPAPGGDPALLSELNSTPSSDCTNRFNPEHWIVRRFNDCSHLSGHPKA